MNIETTVMPKVSIVIPSRNEDKNKKIESLLRFILNERLPEDRFEIIVVNNGSDEDDRTKEVVLGFKHDHPNIRYEESTPGVSRARNHGASKATGDYILFLDADTRFELGFIKRSMKKMVDRRLDFAGFNLDPQTGAKIDTLILGVNNMMQRHFQLCTGAAMLVRTRFHKEHALAFPENRRFAEDSSYRQAVNAAGGKTGIIDEDVLFDMSRFEGRRAKMIMNQILNAPRLALGLGGGRMEDEYRNGRSGNRFK